MKHENRPKLRTATRQLMKVDRLALQRVRIGDVCTRVWFCIAPNLTMNVVLDTRFIDQFILKNFQSKRKVALWHSPLVAILTSNELCKKKKTQKICITLTETINTTQTQRNHPVFNSHANMCEIQTRNTTYSSTQHYPNYLHSSVTNLRRSRQHVLAVRG